MTSRVVIFSGGETGTRLRSELRALAPQLGFAGFVPGCADPAEQLRRFTEYGLPLCTLPEEDALDPTIRLDLQLRPVGIEDLYRKPWPELVPNPAPSLLTGRVVMVTGAGGSIGSALSLSIARYAPAAIVAFDVSESGLFELGRQMDRRFPGVAFHPEIGSVQNPARVDQLLRAYRPDILYHAAAYKHVPLLEGQLVEAVRNNALATWDLACAARKHGVERFILVSTDKAVLARNVLGLTKRAAEVAVESIACTGLPYFAVRLGNVLGSSGSVSRVFQSQIEHRLPITLTDPRMTRYFTTIAEASRFVLDASALGTGRGIYALDMGNPVKIEKLAREMIALQGLTPDIDVPIVVTGRRAGEELTEELFQAEEVPLATAHPRIRRVDRSIPVMTMENISWAMNSLRDFCADARIDSLRNMLNEICFANASL